MNDNFDCSLLVLGLIQTWVFKLWFKNFYNYRWDLWKDSKFITPVKRVRVAKQLEIRVSQNLAKLGEAHNVRDGKAVEKWSKLCSLGGRVSILALIFEVEMYFNLLWVEVNLNPALWL